MIVGSFLVASQAGLVGIAPKDIDEGPERVPQWYAAQTGDAAMHRKIAWFTWRAAAMRFRVAT